MIRVLTVLSLCFLVAEATYAAGRHDRPTYVSVVGVLKTDRDCARQLSASAERILDTLGATGGTAKLAFARQFRLALEEAKVPKTKSQEAAQSLVRVAESIGTSIPEFAATVRFVQELIAHDKLGFCALPTDCSVGKRAESHLAFTTRGGPAVLLAPVPGVEGVLRWALNYYSTLALAAGENYVARWLFAAHALERIHPGAGGPYYGLYARNYDGSFPPRAGSLNEGFALVVMRMFMTRVKTRSYSHFFPQDTANAEAARIGDYTQLIASGDPEVIQCLGTLGVTEANYLEKTDEVLARLAAALTDATNRN